MKIFNANAVYVIMLKCVCACVFILDFKVSNYLANILQFMFLIP